ncbi:cell wall elongation regulator TseB-like domain-containing protein [Oceanobacillus saliphilus]|uniref:cell wall elongation regulator TseB-like domain-containing protein n=1 Tax=Oceanobacillus saliphilus TaxID=2925834 RepID=UPI00201E0C97|nr:DUF5590 domain-containing protein [Oceanobacillus saliphilus]
MHNTKSNWLMWSSVLLLVIILGCGIYAVYLYNELYDNKTAGFDETSRQILNQTAITEIGKMDQYNGSESYHILYGKNDENEEKLIFYPLEGTEKELTTIDRSEIISEEEILSLWQSQCNGCEFVKINPALENNEPLWEIKYNDMNNRYVMDYVSIYDGSLVEQYRFKRMFN